MTPAEIIASANVTDPERFRYEVESKIKHSPFVCNWPNHNVASITDGKSELIMYNSIGRYIASFKLKAWK